MAEAIAVRIVANLVTKLGDGAFHEICLVHGVEDELRKLKDTLSTIKAALLDADQRKEKGHLMQDWIRKLNDAVYDADDVLDAFATKALQRELNIDGRIERQIREFFSSSNQLVFCYKIGRKIKAVEEKFDKIAANMSKFNFAERLIVEANVHNSNRETHSFVLRSDYSEIIGRYKDKKEILKLIMSMSNNEENVSIIPIVGIGGLGKTRLTQWVYGEERVVKHFEPRLWVCVSEDFEIKSIVKKILKSLTSAEVDNLDTLDQLQIHLRKNLDGKRYLLVLDDVWNEDYEKWVPIKNLLMGGAKGSKIVVTTRSGTVASVMGTKNSYILNGLTEKKSWTLFERIAFRGQYMVHPNLEVIGKEIVERCKGVPLAIRSLASVMQSKTQESEWLSIKNSDIWSLCQGGGDILTILKLSYDDLPMHLKQCFAYCSIFPKDHKIEKEVLIQLWMAQGYVQSSNGGQFSEDIGDEYFMNLLSRSFFQEVEVDDYNKVVSCKMHDLALRVASDCSIVKTNEDSISERARHVSFVYNNLKELPRQLLKAKGLRTFLPTCEVSSRETSTWNWHQDSRFKLISSNFKCLRVLDVRYRGVKKVSYFIGKLQLLRYLDLSGNDITSLPNSISNLVNLQTLKLSYCTKIKRLPTGITKLTRLRYLMVDGCRILDHMPNGMGMLTSLRKLDKFVVGGHRRSIRLSELNALNELSGDISIEGLDKVRDVKSESNAANLMSKQYLHSLKLGWRIRERKDIKLDDDCNMEEILLEGLQPHPNLRKLEIDHYSGRLFPSWMISLPNIVRITLNCCDRCQHIPPLLYQLPCLKFLTLIWLMRVQHIEEDNNHLARKSSSSSSLFFPSLEELYIKDLRYLKGWWRAAEGTVVNDGLISSSSSITEEEEESSLFLSQQRPSFPCLTTLKIDSSPRFTSMPMAQHLQELELNDVPEKLIHQLLTTTTTAEGCATSSSFSSPLSKLRSLQIWDIEDLEYLPVRNLPSLEHLDILSCPILSHVIVVSEEEEEEGFRGLTSLCSLRISMCDSITSLSPPETPLYLTALQSLTISSCDNFDLSGDGVHWQGLMSLCYLEIDDIPKLVSLPVGLQHVTTLQHLEIRRCHDLMALPGWISNLNSLQNLVIDDCPLLTERCLEGTGEDWPNISHIPNIVINDD